MTRLLALGLLAGTAACGGGGGVSSPGTVAVPVPTAPAPTPVPTPPPTPTVATPADLVANPRPASRSASDTAEFRVNYTSNELIRALYAANAGLTGRGVTVGVIDGGFYVDAAELAGHRSSLSRDFGNIKTPINGSTTSFTSTPRNDVGLNPSDTHGSLVASLIAASRDGRGSVGIAPDASLAYLRADDAIPSQPNADGTVNFTLTGANIAAAINYAASNRIPILNLSLGITGGSSTGALAQSIDAYARSGGLFVIAAGNEGGANPESIQLLTPTSRPNWLAVGGLSNTLTSFQLDSSSNRAGTLSDRYIVAPYNNVVADVQGSGLLAFGGTSGAVPLVAGAAALVLQKWPQLTGREAGNVLLATARDIGDPGVDPVFGHGLLDIQAALSPVDPVLVVPTGSAVPVANSTLALPAGVGTGQITRLLSSAVVLDAFGRDFHVDAGRLVQARSDIGAVGGLVASYAGRRSNVAATGTMVVVTDIEFASGPVRDGEPRARLAGGTLAVGIGGAQFAFSQGRAPWSGASAAGLGPQVSALTAYAPGAVTTLRAVLPAGGGALTFDAGSGADAGMRGRGVTLGPAAVQAAAVGWAHGGLSLGGGIVSETGSLFGSRSAGALQLGAGADTVFGEARFARAVGGWQVSAYGSVGVTAVRQASASLLTAPSRLTTTRFGIDATRAFGASVLSLGLAQPLNVEQGSATLNWSDGYDLGARALTFRSERVSLAGDRQLLATLGVSRGTFRFGLVEGLARAETGVVASYGMRF